MVDAISAGVPKRPSGIRASSASMISGTVWAMLGHRGVDHAGHHRVHADAARRPLHREVVRQARDPGLGGAVAGHHRHGPQRRQRRQVDHAGTAGGVERSALRSPTVNRYGAVRLSATDASNPSGSASLSPPGKFAPALLTSTSSVLVAETNSSIELGVGQDELPVGHPGRSVS